MKKNCFRVLMSLLAAVMLGMPVIYAESEGSLSATIPFDFIVGKTTLPAGAYTVSALGNGARTLQVRSTDFKSSIMVVTLGVHAVSAKNEPRLVFHRYGNKHFLVTVWSDYSKEGRGIPESSLEREITRNQKSVSVRVAAQAR